MPSIDELKVIHIIIAKKKPQRTTVHFQRMTSSIGRPFRPESCTRQIFLYTDAQDLSRLNDSVSQVSQLTDTCEQFQGAAAYYFMLRWMCGSFAKDFGYFNKKRENDDRFTLGVTRKHWHEFCQFTDRANITARQAYEPLMNMLFSDASGIRQQIEQGLFDQYLSERIADDCIFAKYSKRKRWTVLLETVCTNITFSRLSGWPVSQLHAVQSASEYEMAVKNLHRRDLSKQIHSLQGATRSNLVMVFSDTARIANFNRAIYVVHKNRLLGQELEIAQSSLAVKKVNVDEPPADDDSGSLEWLFPSP